MARGRPRKERSEPLAMPPSWPQRPKPVSPQRPGENDCEWFLRVLPGLPKPPMAADGRDDVVAEWMESILFAGGPKLLEIIWQPINWPLSASARGRHFHTYAVLSRRGEAEAQRKAEAAARERQHEAERARVAKLREAGWA